MAKRYQSSPRALEQKGSTTNADVAIEPEVEQPGRKELTESTAASIRWRSFYTLVPVIIALITSINSLSNYFAADDLQQVLGSSFIKRIGNLPAAFTTSVWSFTAADIIFTVDSYFRPLFNTLFILNYALFGTAPWGWHLVNVLIHAGVTLLVFVVAREMIGRNWVAALTATLFAVHPSHAESVAWVSGITDPLMMLMLLPAFYFYLRFRKQGLKYQIVCALAFFFLGLLCKETAVALPVVVAFCELFYFKSEMPLKQRLLRASKILALFAIPIAMYLLIRYNALNSLVLGGELRYPLVPSLLTVPLAIAKYLKLIFIPWGYSYQHPTDFVESAGSVLFLVPVALLLAIVIGIARLKSRELTFCAVWFIVMLAPALAALRQFEPAYLVQDRYLYAPSIGICLAIALGIEWFARRDWFGTRQRAVATAVAALLVLVWGAVLMRQNRVWDDTLAKQEQRAVNLASDQRTTCFRAPITRQGGRARRRQRRVSRLISILDAQPPT